MKIKVIASGSKGNCTLIQTPKLKILIDVGISYQNLITELNTMNISPKEIDYVLLTHVHSDHMKGLASFVNKTDVKVYILEEMLEFLKNRIPTYNLHFYQNPLELEDLKIELIRISHDVEGVGFIIQEGNHSLVYITDTGYINQKYLPLMKNKDVYIIESNHDEKMLMEGPYPYILKQRVMSDKGHLSNSTTAEYLVEVVGKNTKKIILAHISEHNNTEELALQTIEDTLKENGIDKEILIAKQYEPLEEIEV